MTPPFTQTHDRLRAMAKVHKWHIPQKAVERFWIAMLVVAGLAAYAITWLIAGEMAYAPAGRAMCGDTVPMEWYCADPECEQFRQDRLAIVVGADEDLLYELCPRR